MKKITLLFTSLLLFLGFTTSCMSISNSSNYSAAAQGTYRGSVPFVFIEHGVEFAIYPNGEFDFAYVGIDYRHNPYNGPRRPFSYNTGYDYDLYLQFDRYGAVIQIESVPVFYDLYGRIRRAGNINIRYMGDWVSQIGDMHIIYERNNVYLASSGYVNIYNRNLKPRPWHSYYTTPHYTIVYKKPYRENYNPHRYSYTEHQQRYANRGRANYDNGRRTFYDPMTNMTRRNSTIIDNGRRENTQTTTTNRGNSNSATNNGRRENTQITTNRGNNNSTNSRRESLNTTNNSRNTSIKKEETTRRPNTRRETNTSTNRNQNTTPPATQENNRGRSSSGGRR